MTGTIPFKKVLITGGAGFVGSNLAVAFKRAFADVAVLAFDNLKRRGSEMNLPRLKRHGVAFLHGDIRCREDVETWPAFDLLIDCSAEPSVQAGVDGFALPTDPQQLDRHGALHGSRAPPRGRVSLSEHQPCLSHRADQPPGLL
jgi:nucleoside-diphosphate-sugar epimerase